MKLIARSLSLAMLVVIAASAHAQTFAFDTPGNGTQNTPTTAGTAGYTFTVNSAITVTELDVMDIAFHSAAIPVGIWDSGGTLLTSATISTTAPAVTTPSASGFNFIGTPISSLSLTPGNYTIGAFGNTGDTVFRGGTILNDPSVTYGSAATIAGASLAQPTPRSPGVAALGPSFKITPVPAPSSLTVFIGAAGIGGMMLRRRKK